MAAGDASESGALMRGEHGEDVTLPVALAVLVHTVGNERTVGAALVRPRRRANQRDRQFGELVIHQFLDNEQLTALESVVVQAQPDRVFVATSAPPGAWRLNAAGRRAHRRAPRAHARRARLRPQPRSRRCA
jgi:hypothetical protein